MTDSSDLALPSLQELQSAEQMELLNVVDSLRAIGLSEIVDLPQLIVCGDQSSGKSSVLEAISGIPFPRQDNLCTRFATEVILRRASKDDISVSIVPGEDREPADRDRLLRFRRDLKTREDFKGLFEVARDAMGLTSTGKSFSNDILRVTFCGPSQPQLTLVDLPGLIHSETKSQTAGDVKLVHNLVSGYLKNPRSIILAVVSAKNDIGNQIILRRAREVDPRGLRTLGIITKPDLLVKGSKSEEAFIALARNEDVKFFLGWHVVKNLDVSLHEQNVSRDEQETTFFQESGFKCLPAHITGINPLRNRLSKVLFNQIRTELPRLVEDIQSQISIAKTAQEKLGPSRKEPEEELSFLISLSQAFHTICRDAARGDYEHEFFQNDSNPERRLCAKVMNMHFDFAKNIRKNGAYWLVDDEDALEDDDPRYRTREEAIEEACVLLKRSRGRELPGLPNPLLVGELFRQYSRPWGNLARDHIKNVWEATNRFFELLLRHLTDDDVYENIFRFWLHPIMEEKLSSAYTKLDELLEVHNDYPMTTNSQFVNNRKGSRQDPSKANLEAFLNKSILSPEQNVSVDEIANLLSAMNSKADLDMDMIAAEEAFDNMNVYYEVALNLFTDNVPTLTIQAPIIREVPKMFCPTAVFSMDAETVKRIAGETEEKILERDNVVRRLSILENGALICKRYAKRPQASVNLSPNDTELSTAGSQRSGKNGEKTTSRTPFTATNTLGSAPSKATTSNIFGHISNPAQTNDSNTFGQRSLRDAGSTVSNAEPAGTSTKETTNTQSRTSLFGGSSFGSTVTKQSTEPNVSLSSSTPTGVSIFGNLNTETPGTTKPSLGLFGVPLPPQPTSSLFSSNSKATGTSSLFPSSGTTATNQQSSIFGEKPAAPAPRSLFGSNNSGTPATGSLFGNNSGTAVKTSNTPASTASNLATNNSAFSGSGLFSTPAKTNSSQNNFGTPTQSEWIPTTKLTTFKPFIEREPNSSCKLMNSFQHICFRQEFQKYSCEELRLADQNCHWLA